VGQALVGKSVKEQAHRISSMALAAGFCVLGLTIVMAVTANSLAIWADVVATIIDTLAVFIAWLVGRTARSGRKDSYHFGYGRLETLASFGMGQLMLVTTVMILAVVAWKLIRPSTLAGFGVYLSLGGNVIFGCFNLFVYDRSRRLGRVSESPTLTAQRRLYLNKAFSNLMFIVAFSLALFAGKSTWAMYIDPAISIIIAATLLLAATQTLGSSGLDLIDRSLEEQDQLLILRALAEHFDDYTALHGIRTRRSGTKRYVELYLEFDPDRPMGQVQDIIEGLRTRISGLVKAAEVTVIPTRTAPEA
jgi:ferrous-iron efflux pump FieF